MVKKIFLTILSLILTQSFLFAASPSQIKSGESAVNFNLWDLENEKISLAEFRGKPVILFFWTSWCPFCREELKQLNLNYRELSENNVEVLAININEPVEKIQRFIRRYPFSGKILLDKDATVARGYGILGVPTYIFIDKEGRFVSYSHYFSPEKYKGIIAK